MCGHPVIPALVVKDVDSVYFWHPYQVSDRCSYVGLLHVWVFCFAPFVCMSVLCQYHTVFITIVLQSTLRSGMVIPPALFFLAHDCAVFQEFPVLPNKFKDRVFFSISLKNEMGI